MNFNEAFEKIIELEGPPTNDPKDPGGMTKWGISKRSYPDVDIMALTKEQAKNIYYRDYWYPLNLDKLPDNIRLVVFDCAVNQGQLTAAKLLQKIVDTKLDGIIGAKTIAAINKYKGNLKATYLLKRAFKYSKTKNYDVFGNGWINRLCEVA